MYTPLKSLSEDEYRHLAQLGRDEDSSELADAIRLISGREYADRLAGVTSLGQLRLTTAIAYNDNHYHWHHPSISIALTRERKIALSYNPGGEGNPKDTASTVVPTPQAAADYVDLMMIRMSYDTERVLGEIARAKARKLAYEETKPEQNSAPNSGRRGAD